MSYSFEDELEEESEELDIPGEAEVLESVSSALTVLAEAIKEDAERIVKEKELEESEMIHLSAAFIDGICDILQQRKFEMLDTLAELEGEEESEEEEETKDDFKNPWT